MIIIITRLQDIDGPRLPLRLGAIDMIFPGSHATRSEIFLARRHSKRVKRIVIGTKKKTKPFSYRTLLLSRLRMRFSHRLFLFASARLRT